MFAGIGAVAVLAGGLYWGLVGKGRNQSTPRQAEYADLVLPTPTAAPAPDVPPMDRAVNQLS